ncbi:hypothetical protein N008_08445 [Hymenobacter sp. APR13]|nr:hypothetical protein N008_08445 [Hymenobacter sp. APR13]
MKIFSASRPREALFLRLHLPMNTLRYFFTYAYFFYWKKPAPCCLS